jgi:hypothetical protein
MQPSDNQKMQQDSQQPLQADGSEFADIEPPMPMQDLICSICMEVLRNPDMRLVCGGHVYCRRCIRARKNTGGSGGGGVGSGGSGGGVNCRRCIASSRTNTRCPECRAPKVQKDFIRKVGVSQ